jgi:hypothetical protein
VPAYHAYQIISSSPIDKAQRSVIIRVNYV